MEPALTNIGIVLPEPGYLDGVRRLTREHGTLLINDETHTFSAGPGGATAAWGLEPDVVTIGKAIAGGIPVGAYGVSAELADAIAADEEADLVDVGGVGGTLAGNALSIARGAGDARARAHRRGVRGMTARATRFTAGVQRDDRRARPAVVGRPARRAGRVPLRLARRRAPARESAAAGDPELDDYLHVYLANRGILITPFHNMALMCPQTTDDDVDRHTEIFAAAVRELVGGAS